MAKLIYKEEQRGKQFDLMALAALFLVLMSYVLVTRYFMGHAAADPLTVAFIVSGIVACAACLLYLLSVRLEISLSNKDIRFQYFPLHRKMQKIRLDEIESCEVVETPAIAQYSGWAVSFGEGMHTYSLSGRTGLLITLKSGETLFIGSQNPSALKKAVCNVLESR